MLIAHANDNENVQETDNSSLFATCTHITHNDITLIYKIFIYQ